MAAGGDECLVWIGPRGGDADCIAWSGRLAGVVCCDWTPELESLRIPVVSLERKSGVRRLYSSADMELLIARLPEILGALRSPVCVYPYRLTPSLREASRRLGFALAPAILDPILDDKIGARRLLTGHGLPVPPWRVVGEIDDLAVTPWAPEASIVQAPHSSLGRGTVLASPETPFNELLVSLGPPPWLISRRIEGPVLNVNAVATPDGIAVACPSVQIVDDSDPRLPFRYGGNDFSMVGDLSGGAREEVERLTHCIGHILTNRGQFGPFGVDYCLGPHGPVVIEINPRCQGSSAQLTNAELRHGQPPTLSAWLGVDQPRPCGAAGLLKGAERLTYAKQAGLYVARHEEEATGLPVAGTWVEAGAVLGRTSIAPV